MFGRLLFLFTVVPLTELWLLLEIGKVMGPLPTIALVIGTGFLGAALAKNQGLRTMQRVQRETASGRLPTEALLDGMLILIAGAVLLTPGILTDFLGFFLLIPWGRSLVRKAVASRMRGRIVHATSAGFSTRGGSASSGPSSGGPVSGGPTSGGTTSGAPASGGAAPGGPPRGSVVIDVEPPDAP